MQPHIINCDIHDLIEIICMRNYQIQLDMQDGSTLTGRANTTVSRQGQEYLQLEQTQQLVDVALLQIVRIQVLTPGAAPREIRPNAAPGCPI
ncbi:Rho-binding antiterminator [Rheinheimera sp. F8]|uniref:Rho-binding antiterminator n=1 Tax=Rheinheimera sp. F8 TaxID=1763998 RepID=UPI000744C77F|nr:Rho-binding antiterminator [Rheinheimera sp. F8]ALZ77284.1 hypothetical protein ATY27_16980 [Rheinheimera sp. F8]